MPMTTDEPAPDAHFISIRQLSKTYDNVVAVDRVSIDIRKGEIFALLGSSGCGKSTLLRMLAGFEQPTAGAMLLDGVDIARMPPYERPINMMFQSYALFPHLSVWDNVAFGLKRDGLSKQHINERVSSMLNTVKLTALAKRKPHQLSGGQQQRVALARCLAKSPKLLLLDEPLGALDRKLREETQYELHSIIKKVGVTCVVVTHDQEEAMTLADRIAIMSDGRFLQVGKPHEIYETPSCRFVADFIGNVNLFDGTLIVDEPDHCKVQTSSGTFFLNHGITGTLGMSLSVALRPEKIHVQRQPPQDSSCNCLQGVINGCGYFGSYSRYQLQLASGALVRIQITHDQRYSESFKDGETMYATFSGDSLVALLS